MKNIFNIKYIIIALASFSSISCTDFFLEQNENSKYNDDIIWASPKLSEGVLLKAYQSISNDYATSNMTRDDYMTSDMAVNILTDGSINLSSGAWTARDNYLSFYSSAYDAFIQINNFLENVDNVDFAPQSDQEIKDAFSKKMKGEAFGLRAWWGMNLLRAHGGLSESGELLGYPIVISKITGNEAYLPRNTYRECVDQIIKDCDEAIDLLPLTWKNSGDMKLDQAIGLSNANRINGITVMAIKAKVLLTAASEAFKLSGITWDDAAKAAEAIMKVNGGISALDPKGLTFYAHGSDEAGKEYLNACSEVFWYTSIISNLNREMTNYAPSLLGKGTINPSQNLVDAFGDKDGYPILSSSIYNSASPFENRDPRLKQFIYCDGDVLPGGSILDISTSLNMPGANKYSSRTGYYLRKLLDERTTLTAGMQVKGYHYRALMRYTEVLLNFAEAANEIGGPDHNIGGFTPKAVINALRKRAGISDETYVNSLDQAGLRKLIRNERRIELCFENHRFYDLCRWADVASMNEDVKGIKEVAGVYSTSVIEERNFSDYMIYSPIPYSETLKYDIQQNKGW